jgi:O-methyltransferase involved in polyketide biosynthesis
LAKTDLIQNKLGIKNIQNLYFSPASALDFKALLEALKFADLKNPLAVYCEGFLDYLSLEEKTQAVYNIKKILSKYGGVFITPDPSASIARRADQYTFLPRYRESIKKVEITTGQNYDDYAFKDEQDADMLFQSNQWTED